MLRRAALCLALVLLLGACVMPPPRLSLRAASGLVRAESVAQATLVARLLDELAPEVRRLLPETREQPLEVWVQRELGVYRGFPVRRDVPAFTLEKERRIHMLEGPAVDLSAALAHELVHALLGSGWATLPPVAEEGLADWVQERLNPRVVSALRVDHLVKASAAFGGLPFGVWAGWPSNELLAGFLYPPGPSELLDPHAALEGQAGRGGSGWLPYAVSVSDPRLYGIGYLVVSRIIERSGVAGLHHLCLRARAEGEERVPAAWLLEEAELGEDPAAWQAAIVERIGPSELVILASSLLGEIVATLVDRVAPQMPHLGARQFLLEIRPRLGLVGGAPRIRLYRLADLVQALLGAWPPPTEPRLTAAALRAGTLSWDAASPPPPPAAAVSLLW